MPYRAVNYLKSNEQKLNFMWYLIGSRVNLALDGCDIANVRLVVNKSCSRISTLCNLGKWSKLLYSQ